MLRDLCIEPPPQSPEHAPQPLHAPRTHGRGGTSRSPDGLASTRNPRHGLPPFLGACRTERERRSCRLCRSSSQCPHGLQAVKAQSSLLVQAGVHRFVLTNGPWQGWPHSLFFRSMARKRSQRPMHVGSCHSPQAPNAHGTGLHTASQDFAGGHCPSSICDPLQLAGLSWARSLNNELLGRGTLRLRERCRARVATPQPVGQPFQADHSCQ
mmetsp:Transcript_110456/g.356533  ORF Transcript_110456/g.356533 Transcript_110456/m.356533 type:complete len:211 (-) Transcript_110456:1241-1873(-)